MIISTGQHNNAALEATAAHEREHAVGSDDAEVDTDTDLAWHATSELRQWRCGLTEDGQRLDRVLAMLVPEFSRNHLSQLVEQGAVQVNGRQVTKPAYKVRLGDSGQIQLQATPQSQAFRPENIPLTPVYEDEHLLVLNKPAGLVVHPAPGHWSGTLLNGLLARYDSAANLPRAGIVHRLDKDTSGLMVVARTRATMDALVRMIAARQVTRQYLALAHGPWRAPAKLQVQEPIGRDPRNRLRMAVVDLQKNAGKPAQTQIELLQNCPAGCLLLCTLGTGRTHQIRVHLAATGHPLLADPLYGGANAAGMQRQALHAAHLRFVHPISAAVVDCSAALPEDFQAAFAAWGLRYNRAPSQ